MLLLQIAFWLTMILEVPVIRQVLGFLYLTLVPGFAISRLLRLKLEAIETVLISAGLSIAFLMGTGFALNLIGPVVGVPEPLSTTPLVVVTGALVTVMLILGGREERGEKAFKRLPLLAVVFACLVPTMGIVGTVLTNGSVLAGSLILYAMFLVAAGAIAFTTLVKLPSHAVCSLILLAIALALLFHMAFFTNYIVGHDIWNEYSVFRLTMSSSFWNPAISDRQHAMLSVTVLPTVYSNLLSLDGTGVMKIVYPLIFAIVPLGLFQLLKPRFGKHVAFFSVFFFISDTAFFNEVAQLPRQIIGELFYVLLLLVIFKSEIRGQAKWLLFVIFSFGMVVSHYSLAYLFLAFAAAVWIAALLRKRKSQISTSMIALFAIMTFSWYLYVAQSVTFDVFLEMANRIRAGFLTDFFQPTSRGTQVLAGAGLLGSGTFWHTIGRSLFYATVLLVIVGLVTLLMKKKTDFFNDDINILMFLNTALVAIAIIVPNLAPTFNMSRFYHVSLYFLSPLCILGGVALLNWLFRSKVNQRHLCQILVLGIIIPYFLFQTGLVYEVTKEESWSLPLSRYRFDSLFMAERGVITDMEVRGARWLAAYTSIEKVVYADVFSTAPLRYQNVGNIAILTSHKPTNASSCIYLREFNVKEQIVQGTYTLEAYFNLSQIDATLNASHIVYSGGYCEVLAVP